MSDDGALYGNPEFLQREIAGLHQEIGELRAEARERIRAAEEREAKLEARIAAFENQTRGARWVIVTAAALVTLLGSLAAVVTAVRGWRG